MKKIEFDDIPNYTDLIYQIISQKKIKRNTKASVLREYNNEKWKDIIQKFKNKSSISYEDVLFAEVNKKEENVFYKKNEGFFLAKNEDIINQHIEIYESILSQYAKNSAGLVEIGAGFGGKLITLSRRKTFEKLNLYAGELTESGRYLINFFSNKMKVNIKTQHYDFRTSNINNFKIPENCIIFTSYALCYIPVLRKKFIKNILNLKPKSLVFFEPCYEHHNLKTVHDMLCKKYIELNDYTRNLGLIIHELSNENQISVKINKNVIGSNPFLPISVIEILPKY